MRHDFVVENGKYIFTTIDENNVIVATCTVDMLPHVGSIATHPDYCNQNIMTSLISYVESTFLVNRFKGYYMLPSNKAASRVAEKNGLVKLDLEVWEKRF